MSNIKKFFNKTSKKRDLNGESSPEEDKKNTGGGSSTISNDDAAEDEVLQHMIFQKF